MMTKEITIDELETLANRALPGVERMIDEVNRIAANDALSPEQKVEAIKLAVAKADKLDEHVEALIAAAEKFRMMSVRPEGAA